MPKRKLKKTTKRRLIRDPDSMSVHKIFRDEQNRHNIKSGDVDYGWWGKLSDKIENKGMTKTALKTEVKKYYSKNKKMYK